MPKEVIGYMTEDGVFFDREEDARFHEATQAIKRLCDSHKPKPITVGRYTELLQHWHKEILEYINAYQAALKSEDHTQEDTGAVDRDQADDADGNAQDASVV